MKNPTVAYPSYPPRRRRKGGCSCDQNYAKSLQGICKVIALICGMLTFIIIGASPYWRSIFVVEAVTWPFHIVMLLTISMWLATGFMYGFFLTRFHLDWPHIAWPKVELEFNVAMVIITLVAAILEAANVWRWDMSRGFQTNLQAGSSAYNNIGSLGYRPGMTFSQSMGFNSYCSRYPNDCRDYFALLTGHSSYYGNHIFATILLFVLLICYMVATFFAFRTWRVFRRDMHKERDPNAPLPKPSAWARFRFRMSEVKVPTTAAIAERFQRAVNRNGDANPAPENDVEIGTYSPTEKVALNSDDDSTIKKSHHSSSVYSGSNTHKSHRSHHSHHTSSDDRRSRSSSGTRKHKQDADRDSDYHSSSKSGKRSQHSGSESRSKHHRSSDKENSRKDDDVVGGKKRSSKSKDDVSSTTTSPVASFMV